jgi:transposase
MIFGYGSGASIYLCTRVVDMRKSFDGLSGAVRQHLDRDPVSGDYFVFVNRRCDLMKILVWDRHGFWVLAKRLEAGRFRVPQRGDPAGISGQILPWEELLCMIEGIDLSKVRRQKRFSVVSDRNMLTKADATPIL